MESSVVLAGRLPLRREAERPEIARDTAERQGCVAVVMQANASPPGHRPAETANDSIFGVRQDPRDGALPCDPVFFGLARIASRSSTASDEPPAWKQQAFTASNPQQRSASRETLLTPKRDLGRPEDVQACHRFATWYSTWNVIVIFRGTTRILGFRILIPILIFHSVEAGKFPSFWSKHAARAAAPCPWMPLERVGS
ncbi:hypothetical protein BT67DRAFT_229817 [Trichocladium antarcticum]|uniref:Uncharacterized protein n=1 Tax=Trichocladium antarcticum TaxID=1450529 RepID=A0AAN6UNG7_9PEZI|nr:hypothetical protein BT67DRAFT_229817 [Trichocladium antarcticum]